MDIAYAKNCVGRCSQSHSEYEYGECVVEMHVPLIQGTAHGKFKVLGGTELTLSMPMLVANGNKVVFQRRRRDVDNGERRNRAVDEYDWYLKVLINNRNKFLRVDVWTSCYVCPPSWVRN